MSPLIRPVVFIWTNDGRMAPMPRFKRMCDQQFVVGEEYPLAIIEARSRQSHSHYFASVHEGWKNLPEKIAERFPSAEALRKHALCKTGFCTKKEFLCDSEEHATRLAAFVRSTSEYAVITIHGRLVEIFEAESQAAHAMGKERFQASKDAVLDYISELIRVPTRELRREGAKHFPEPKKVQK